MSSESDELPLQPVRMNIRDTNMANDLIDCTTFPYEFVLIVFCGRDCTKQKKTILEQRLKNERGLSFLELTWVLW